jgi:hypothetical protein
MSESAPPALGSATLWRNCIQDDDTNGEGKARPHAHDSCPTCCPPAKNPFREPSAHERSQQPAYGDDEAKNSKDDWSARRRRRTDEHDADQDANNRRHVEHRRKLKEANHTHEGSWNYEAHQPLRGDEQTDKERDNRHDYLSTLPNGRPVSGSR